MPKYQEPTLVEIHNKEEAIQHGKHCGWCTGKVNDSSYNIYYHNKAGRLFVIYKAGKRRPSWQLFFQYGTGSYELKAKASDVRLTLNTLFKAVPTLKKPIKNIRKKAENHDSEIRTMSQEWLRQYRNAVYNRISIRERALIQEEITNEALGHSHTITINIPQAELALEHLNFDIGQEVSRRIQETMEEVTFTPADDQVLRSTRELIQFFEEEQDTTPTPRPSQRAEHLQTPMQRLQNQQRANQNRKQALAQRLNFPVPRRDETPRGREDIGWLRLMRERGEL